MRAFKRWFAEMFYCCGFVTEGQWRRWVIDAYKDEPK